jgi:two-component system response regulator DesR
VIRVLLAEDQVMFRTAVRRLLELEDDLDVVAEVARGDEIVPAALAARPDVAVVDIELPAQDGISAASDLRQRLPAIDVARRQVGTRAAQELMAEGQAMDLEQAIAAALRDDQRSSAGPCVSPDPLTRREREVAVLLAEGLSNRQIAERLVIAEKTAALHVEHILAKLGLHSRWQAADWVRRQPEREAMGTP